MRKRDAIILLIIISFFFTPRAASPADDIFSESEQPESMEEVSSKIRSSMPRASSQYVDKVAEAVYLINELKREIDLTRQILGISKEDEGLDDYIPPVVISKPREVIPSYAKSPKAVEFVRKITGKQPTVLAQKPSSEESGISRDDMSDTADAISREEAGKTTTTPYPQPKRLNVYTKKELWPDMRSVVIEKEQEVLVPAKGLRRFMVIEPSMLTAQRVGDKISVTGVGLGRTYLHIWDVEGRRTVKFTVTQKGYKKYTTARKKAVTARQMDSFKARYSYDQYRFDSSSETASRAYMYEEYYHRLNITGQTPWGKASSRLQYEGRSPSGDAEDTSDLTSWDFNLTGEDIELSMGNVGAYFSDLTLPRTGYQGVRFKNPDSEKVNYDLVWGARGNRMWGYRVLEWDTANYFYGGRAQVEPADFIHFNTTYMRAAEYADEAADWVVAGGMGLNFFDDAIEIEAEAARNKSAATELHNHAYRVDTTIDLEDYDLTLKGSYKDVDPDFRVVTGTTAPDVGRLGVYLDADYSPFKYLRVTGEYDAFRNRYNFNAAETQRYNHDWRSTIDFSAGEDTRFKFMFWNRNREGEATPMRGHGETYQVSQHLPLAEPFKSMDMSFRYEPTKYKNLNDLTPNYRERKYTTAMRMNVVKNLYYDLSHSWHYRKMTESAEHGLVKSFGTGIFYSMQILDSPFYGSGSLRYKKEYGVIDNITLSSGENAFTGQGEIKYRPSSELETYLRVNYRRVRGILDHSKSRQETRIYGGGSFYFDSTLRWGLGGSIEGFIFEDLNGNGDKDAGEKGFAGIDVYAGEDHATVTGPGGGFEFRSIKGYELPVMYDPRMLPDGYKSTTPNPQTAMLEHGITQEVYFGVLAVAEISGIVFHDINMNGEFDADDEGVRGALLALDDGLMAISMATGHFRLEEVRPGKKTLTLDPTSLPHHLLSLKKVKRDIEAEGGKNYDEKFPLYALRTIVGAIFIDDNKNGRFDTDEEGVPDIVVRCRDSATLTDNKGGYFLKKLPGGKQEVAIDVESIPSQYELAVSSSRNIELRIDGEIKKDVNFAVKRK